MSLRFFTAWPSYGCMLNFKRLLIERVLPPNFFLQTAGSDGASRSFRSVGAVLFVENIKQAACAP